MAENLKNFRIQCIPCDNLKRQHNTELFVNWEKHYYLITCLTCNITEAFNMKGKQIELKGEVEVKSDKEEKKVTRES